MPNFTRYQYQMITIYLFMMTVGGKNADKENYIRQLGKTDMAYDESIDEVIQYCNCVSVGNSNDNSNDVIKELIKLYYPYAENKIQEYEKIIKTLKPTDVDKMAAIVDSTKNKSAFFTDELGLIAYSALVGKMCGSKQSDNLKLMCRVAKSGFRNPHHTYGEKKALAFIGVALRVDKLTIAEFIDTIDTILEIENQKSYIKSLNRPYVVISERLKKMDKNIEVLKNNIKIMIEEADIA